MPAAHPTPATARAAAQTVSGARTGRQRGWAARIMLMRPGP